MKKDQLIELAKQVGACQSWIDLLAECEDMGQVEDLLREHKEAIADIFNIEPVPETIDEDDVMDYLQKNIAVDPYLAETVLNMIPMSQEKHLEKAGVSSGNYVKSKKIELFLSIIDDVSIGQIEELYVKARPNSYEASLKLAI